MDRVFFGQLYYRKATKLIELTLSDFSNKQIVRKKNNHQTFPSSERWTHGRPWPSIMGMGQNPGTIREPQNSWVKMDVHPIKMLLI